MIEQGYSVPEAAASLGIRTNQLYDWKKKQEEPKADNLLTPDEKAELLSLRKEVMSQMKGQGGLDQNSQIRSELIRINLQEITLSRLLPYPRPNPAR